MAKKPSRDMLTAGVVGSYLMASAWLIVVMGTIVAIMGGIRSFEMGWVFGMLGVIAGLLLIGGTVCEGIGWIALGRLYPGTPALIGWLEAALPVIILFIFSFALTTFRADPAMGHVVVVLLATHLFLAFLWMVTHQTRARTLPAALGYGLALLSGVTLYILALAEARAEMLQVVLLFTYATGAAIAHFGTAIVFGKSRALADSVNTF